MSGLQGGASDADHPPNHEHVPGGATALGSAHDGTPAAPTESAQQPHPQDSSEGSGHAPEAARGAAGAVGQPAGQLGDLPDKPGHLASAEQCRLANGGVCWHLLQMAVRARQIAQKSEDNSVSKPALLFLLLLLLLSMLLMFCCCCCCSVAVVLVVVVASVVVALAAAAAAGVA